MYKRISGLVMLSMGVGMILVIFVPGWGFVLAAGIVFIGFKLLTCK